jgi:hypothetical protein
MKEPCELPWFQIGKLALEMGARANYLAGMKLAGCPVQEDDARDMVEYVERLKHLIGEDAINGR